MKHSLWAVPVLLLSLLIACSKDTAGTEIEVSTGTIYGKLLIDGETIDDTVTVFIYDKETDVSGALSSIEDPVATVISDDGSYRFEDLDFDGYKVVVVRDSLIVGRSEEITLDPDHREEEVDVATLIIINQTFTISTDKSTNITINNFTIINGKISRKDSAFILSFPEADTLEFEMEIENDDSTETVTLRIIMEDDTARFEIIKSNVELNVFPGTAPPAAYMKTVTLTVGKPGTLTVESTFKTEDMPETE